MTTSLRPRALVLLAFLVLCASFIASRAQNKPSTKSAPSSSAIPRENYERLIFSVRGPDLFRAHCAPCHGAGGKGDGPVAASLKAKAADLTVLAKNNGGRFPVERAGKFISGEEFVASHGSREMPVWGPIFHQIEEDQDFGNVRLQNLVKYLETIQVK